MGDEPAPSRPPCLHPTAVLSNARARGLWIRRPQAPRFFIPVCRGFPPPKALAPSAHCSLTCAARCPISWQRTNHWLFSRYSTTSPERLRKRQAKCTALWVLCFSPKGHGTLLHARPSEPRTEQQIKLTQSFCSLAKGYVQSPPFCPLQLYSLPSWRSPTLKELKWGYLQIGSTMGWFWMPRNRPRSLNADIIFSRATNR